MKLYRITLQGMTSSGTSTIYGLPYVVANDPTEAYKKLKKYLDKRDLGFASDRELDNIQLLAEEGDYPNCKIQLFL
jgi:hypothetical protein